MGRRNPGEPGRPRRKGKPAGHSVALPAVSRERADSHLVLLREKTHRLRQLIQQTSWRHSALFELAPVGYVLLDPSGLIVEMNLALSMMIGKPRTFLTGSPLTVTIPREDHQIFMDHMRRCRTSDGAQVSSRVRITGTEHLHHVILKSRATLPPDRGALAFVTAVLDDTARTQTHETLQKTEERLRVINAELARRAEVAEQATTQLRLLASQLNMAEQKERRRVAALLHDHLQQFLVSAKIHLKISAHAGNDLKGRLRQVESLIDQAIQASRTLTLELSPPVLHDAGLAAALNWLVRWMADKHHLQVHLDLMIPREPEDMAIKTFLFEAVREMLLNVVKHARVGEARVTLRRSGDLMELVVRDEGAGFEPMARDSDRGEHVGLMTLRERVRHLGGTLEVRSAPGEGTRVRLQCPLPPPKMAVASPPREPGRSRKAAPVRQDGGIRVLIVDDHHFLREGLVRVMEDEGLLVVGEAGDGREAVLKAREVAPDVVIMDVTLPILNGIEATRLIRLENPGISVIGLSMHERKDMEAGMLAAGAAAYLTKGGPMEQLVEKIRELAARPAPGRPQGPPQA
jgi:PAS domain S-box-containing protein